MRTIKTEETKREEYMDKIETKLRDYGLSVSRGTGDYYDLNISKTYFGTSISFLYEGKEWMIKYLNNKPSKKEKELIEIFEKIVGREVIWMV